MSSEHSSSVRFCRTVMTPVTRAGFGPPDRCGYSPGNLSGSSACPSLLSCSWTCDATAKKKKNKLDASTRRATEARAGSAARTISSVQERASPVPCSGKGLERDGITIKLRPWVNVLRVKHREESSVKFADKSRTNFNLHNTSQPRRLARLVSSAATVSLVAQAPTAAAGCWAKRATFSRVLPKPSGGQHQRLRSGTSRICFCPDTTDATGSLRPGRLHHSPCPRSSRTRKRRPPPWLQNFPPHER